MAKFGMLESDPKARVGELKQELLRLVQEIFDAEFDDEGGIAMIDAAGETLRVLTDLTNHVIGKSRSLKPDQVELSEVPPPVEFRCPISHELMKDPVILTSGQTYDRSSIQNWLKSGNRTCPKTQQVLTHNILTPNVSIRNLIAQWCQKQGVKFPDPAQHPNNSGLTTADRDHFLSLIEKMSSTLDHKKEAAKELRSLTKRMPSFRALFGENRDTISKLLKQLPQSMTSNQIHPGLQEDLITTILNISIHDSNKKLVAETPDAVPSLINALKFGSIESRSNSAAALFTLSALDSNKELIGKAGAMKPLIELLEEGHPSAMKDVAAAIFNLCVIHDNKGRAVKDGAIRVLVKKVSEGVCVDESLAILAMLSGHYRTVNELGEMGAIPVLFRIMRESDCARNKENCIAILHSVCLNDRSRLKEMRDEERSHGTISELARTGTSRAKRKASAIVEKLNRLVNITHTA